FQRAARRDARFLRICDLLRAALPDLAAPPQVFPQLRPRGHDDDHADGVLLFVVLFYVYPLKFLWTLAITTRFSGNELVVLPDCRVQPMILNAPRAALL